MRSLDLLEEVGPLESTADLNMGTIARFVASRKGKENPNTTRHHLRKISSVCTIAVGEGWLRCSPFNIRRVWVRSVEPAHPRIHSAAEIAAVLARARQEVLSAHPAKRWAARRLLAVAATAAYSGMRRDEVLRARTEDLHLADGFLNLVARENDTHKTVGACQPVPLAPDLIPVLRGWTAHLGGSEWLFPRKDLASPWVGGTTAARPCGQLKALGARAGVDGFTFMSLRHTWASLAEGWGLTAEQIKRVLRHTNLHTQLGYRHAELTSLRAMVRGVRFEGPPAAAASDPPAVPAPPQIDPAMGARPRRHGQLPHGLAGTRAAAARAAAAAARLGPEVLELRAQGRTLAEIATELNARGHRTRRGYLWGAVAVGRILDRVSPPQ
jgi:integrase